MSRRPASSIFESAFVSRGFVRVRDLSSLRFSAKAGIQKASIIEIATGAMKCEISDYQPGLEKTLTTQLRCVKVDICRFRHSSGRLR